MSSSDSDYGTDAAPAAPSANRRLSTAAANAAANAAASVAAAAQAFFESHYQHDATHPAAVNACRLQQLTRENGGFADLEATLPDAGAELAQSSPSAASPSPVADLLSYLGRRNPAPQPVTGRDCVWLLDNVAFADGAGQYKAEYVVAVLAQHPTSRVVDAVRDVADKLGCGAKDDPALKVIEERITPFLQDVLPGRQVTGVHGFTGHGAHAAAASSGGDETRLRRLARILFPPGGRNGISSAVHALPASPPGSLVPTRAEVPAGTTGLLANRTLFTRGDGRGWGVISDIDDTIKRTQTSDPIGILQTTFVDPPAPIEGMPALYKHVRAAMAAADARDLGTEDDGELEGAEGAEAPETSETPETPGPAVPFFYLSASPYNLYPFLHGFRTAHYPPGALVLRDATLMSVSGLLSTLTLGTQAYKVDRMHKIHGWLPRMRFVCVGDSTQSDPEAYGEIYRTFPGWVGLILIRKVTDIAAVGIAEKNAPQRFEQAFQGVPRSTWHVFEDPSECYALVDELLGYPSEEGSGGGVVVVEGEDLTDD